MNDNDLLNASISSFIDQVFSAVLFSAIASFVYEIFHQKTIDAVTSRTTAMSTQHVTSQSNPTLTLGQQFRIFIGERWVSLRDNSDQYTRITATIVAAFYYYVIYKNRIAPQLEQHSAIVFLMLSLAVVAAICSGAYLFARVEFYALASLLLVSGMCFLGFFFFCEQHRIYFLWRATSHFLSGCLVFFAGWLVTMWTDNPPYVFGGFGRDAAKKTAIILSVPLTKHVLRVLIVGVILWQFWYDFIK